MAEERKLVSILFADIVGSTALGHDNDPEIVRAVLGGYFDRTREIIELHGGNVEKYIGDAVMAVFGVPRVHDDDAERAVRAGLAIQDAIPALNEELALKLEARIGVNSGEVLAAVDEREQRMVTGDVVNVAARLQQLAEPNEVVVGALTEQLSREAVEYEQVEPVAVRGKPDTVGAFRAIRVLSDLPEQARGLPQMRARLVGRNRELTLLADTFERARNDRRGQLFTIVGNAGLGKSRLVGEFLARAGRATDVRVLRGRCLPYGIGITYWPLIELLQADLGVTDELGRDEVLGLLDARLEKLFPQSLRVALKPRLTVLLGLAEAAQALSDVATDRLAPEIGWAFGEYVRATAEQAPVMAVVDDLQWAEPSIIAILRDVVDGAADAPVLVLCIARPELLETHPDWGGGMANATTIVLEPLSEDETRTLIGRLLDVDQMPEQLRTTIVARSGGNPLFCEEFVRMLIDEGRIVREGHRWYGASADSFDVRVPESIQALLAARLDGLAVGSKEVSQAASVIGERFDADQVSRLVRREAAGDLQALVRGGFVLPDRSAGPRTYNFKHLLIRDVAYASLPKSERARLHEAYAESLEADVGDRHAEYVEILAHHAERTLSLSLELRQGGPALEARAQRALSYSLEAGRRAFERGNSQAMADFTATARVAQQALGAASSAHAAELELLEAQAEALTGNFGLARSRLERAGKIAAAAGRADLEADAKLALADVLIYGGGDEDQPAIEEAIESASRIYAAQGNRRGRLNAQLAGLETLFQAGRLVPMLERGLIVVDEALADAERDVAARATARLIGVAVWVGRMAVAERLADQADMLAVELGLLATARQAQFFRARLAWARGDLRAAETIARQVLADSNAAGDGKGMISSNRLLAETLVAMERFVEAEPFLDVALDLSRQSGERWSRTELLAMKAGLRARAGAFAAAEELLAESKETLRDSDYAAVGEYNWMLGLVRSLLGRNEEAEAAYRRRLAALAVADNWSWQMATLDLAEFLIARGRHAEAAPMVTEVATAIDGTDINIRRPQLERLQAELAAASPTSGN